MIFINVHSNVFDFHIFADDTNLFYSNSNLLELESRVKKNLYYVANWLVVNKLSLNIDKSNFILFHPPQNATNYAPSLYVGEKCIKRKTYISNI